MSRSRGCVPPRRSCVRRTTSANFNSGVRSAQALISNFKYHPNTTLLQKDNYTETEWDNILMDNLNHQRPMYYDGYGTGGHAFNVDGYQGTNYFHFNWGWSGSFNGYFYLNNLNPGGDNFTNGQGAIVGFGIKGGAPAGIKFINNVKLASHLANIGDAKTLVIHPASTTHSQQTEAELKAAGISDDYIRVSVGLEDLADITADLDQALKASQQ